MCENLKILVYIYMVQQHFVVCTEVSSGRDGGDTGTQCYCEFKCDFLYFLSCISVVFNLCNLATLLRYYQNLSQTLSATDTCTLIYHIRVHIVIIIP